MPHDGAVNMSLALGFPLRPPKLQYRGRALQCAELSPFAKLGSLKQPPLACTARVGCLMTELSSQFLYGFRYFPQVWKTVLLGGAVDVCTRSAVVLVVRRSGGRSSPLDVTFVTDVTPEQSRYFSRLYRTPYPGDFHNFS